jgi:hypothetical protein
MKQTCIIVFLWSIILVANGQIRDTADHKTPASWKKYHIAPRIGIGTQRAFFTEAGFALQKYIYDAREGFVAYSFYSLFEWTPSRQDQKAITGVKLGCESVFNGSAGALEVKYLSNGEVDDVMITPKIGLGIGFINIFYGYNFSTNKYPFERIRKHQFSLVINTNLLFYANKYEKK